MPFTHTCTKCGLPCATYVEERKPDDPRGAAVLSRCCREEARYVEPRAFALRGH